MKRLTNPFSVMGRKYDLAYGQASTWKRKLKHDKYELIENAIDKLGQYEDNDEKIGINYNIITQALLKGVYYIEFGETQIRHTNGLSLQAYDGKSFCLANRSHSFVMEDYGKTKYHAWALTKEELL